MIRVIKMLTSVHGDDNVHEIVHLKHLTQHLTQSQWSTNNNLNKKAVVY